VQRWLRINGLFGLILIGVMFISFLEGPEAISLGETVRILTFSHSPDPAKSVILLQVRLPRILLAGLVGAILALCGVVFQALLRNPLADPFILGVSSGAALGAYLAILLGFQTTILGFNAMSLMAFGGGLLSIWFVYLIAKADRQLPITGLLLAGVVINAVLSALILFITSVLDADKVMSIVVWLMGHIGSFDYPMIGILAAYTFIGGVLLLMAAKPLNLLTLGEESALTLGLPVERAKKLLLVLTTFLTGAAVSVSGIVGFVGIIAPHAVRMLIGPDHRLLLPASALAGAAFLILADTIARTALGPTEIPVGVLTALCGGPFFLILLKTKKAIG
jgi:ABC-type Fe3+-siderophore transport system permease subunit